MLRRGLLRRVTVAPVGSVGRDFTLDDGHRAGSSSTSSAPPAPPIVSTTRGGALTPAGTPLVPTSTAAVAHTRATEKIPAFLAKMRAARAHVNVFTLPSAMSVDDFLDLVHDFSSRKAGELQRLQPQRAFLAPLSPSVSTATATPPLPHHADLSPSHPFFTLDYAAAARNLSAGLTRGAVMAALRDVGAMTSQFVVPIVPYAVARSLVLQHIGGPHGAALPTATATTTLTRSVVAVPDTDPGSVLRAYFARHDCAYREDDAFVDASLLFFKQQSASGASPVSRSATSGQQHVEPTPRTPVACVMGHIDHGKTTLLDTLQKSAIAAGEAGKITQSVRAFTVAFDGQSGDGSCQAGRHTALAAESGAAYPRAVSFIDTPGHAIFREMRATGHHAADVVLLLIALDEGIQPQTEEIVKSALESRKPIIVALNKADLFSDTDSLAAAIAEVSLALKRLNVKAKLIESVESLRHLAGDDGDAVDRTTTTTTSSATTEKKSLTRKKKSAKSLTSEERRARFATRYCSSAARDWGRAKERTAAAGLEGRVVHAATSVHALTVAISGLHDRGVGVLMQCVRRVAQVAPPLADARRGVLRQAVVVEAHRRGNDVVLTCVPRSGTLVSPGGGGQSPLAAASSSTGSAKSDKKTKKGASGDKSPSTTASPGANGMAFVCDDTWGVVRRLEDQWGVPQAATPPGHTANVLGVQGTGLPTAGCHLLEVPEGPDRAEAIAQHRRRLSQFIRRTPGLVFLLRPPTLPCHFLHVGNFGQVPEDKSLQFKRLFREAEPAAGNDSALEARWRSSTLPAAEQPKTEEQQDARMKDVTTVAVAFKVDSWHSARMITRELPRMQTRHVMFHLLACGFGAVTKQELAEWGAHVKVVVAYRSPKLADPQVANNMTTRNIAYKEFDVYSDMVAWLKQDILQRQAEETARRDPTIRRHKEFSDTVVSAALGQ